MVLPTPEKFCEKCGTRMERRQFTNRREALVGFIRRKFCSRACAGTNSSDARRAIEKIDLSLGLPIRSSGIQEVTEDLVIPPPPESCGNPREFRIQNFIGVLWMLAKKEAIAKDRVQEIVSTMRPPGL